MGATRSKHSARAMANMTKQLKAQLKFLQDDLKHEGKSLVKAKSFLKFNLPGTKSMIRKHEMGIRKTKQDLELLTKRIKRYQKEGKINKIL